MSALNNSTLANDTITFANSSSLIGAGIFILLAVVSLLLNSIGLYYFLFTRHARTPFDWYLITLMISNNAYTFLCTPFQIQEFFLTGWALGGRACSFYLYTAWIIGDYVPLVHCWITVNRFWAVYYPAHYRQHISNKLVIASVLVTLLLTHVLLLPYLYYTYYVAGWPDGKGCDLDYTILNNYGVATNYLFSVLPPLAMWLMYPFVTYKIYRKLHSTSIIGRTSSSHFGARTAAMELHSRSQKEEGESSRCPRTAELPADHRDNLKAKRERLLLSVYVLSFLTVSTIICWVPLISLTYYTDVTLEQLHFAALMYYAQSIVDPICFVFVIPDVRRSFRGWWRRNR